MKTGIQSIYKVSTTMLRISTMSRTSKHKNSQSNPSTFLAHPKMAFRRKAGGIVLCMVGIIFDEMSTSNYLQIGKPSFLRSSSFSLYKLASKFAVLIEKEM